MFTLRNLFIGAALLFSAHSYAQVESMAQARADFATSAGAGTAVTVRGIIGATIHNISATTGANNTTIYIQDKTGGLAVYDKNWTTSPTTLDFKVGDSIEVAGTTSEYYNLLQLGTLTSLKRIDSGHPSRVVPVALSLAKAFTERYESVIVRVLGVTFATNTAFNAKGGPETISDASNNQATVYANAHTDVAGANKLSAGKVNITGIMSQYLKPAVAGDTVDGYELIPRSLSDIDTITTTTTGIENALNALQFEMYPNPARIGNTLTLSVFSNTGTIEIFNVVGQVVYHQQNIQRNKEMMISLPASLSPGIYMVKIQNQNNTGLKKLVIE